MELLRSKSNGVGFMPTLFRSQSANIPTQLTIQPGSRYTTFRSALATRGGALGEVKVSEIMLRNPVTATPDMEVNDLRRTMIESGARYLPVMQDGKLLGVISFRDVAKAVLEEQDFENKMLKGYIKNWPA